MGVYHNGLCKFNDATNKTETGHSHETDKVQFDHRVCSTEVTFSGLNYQSGLFQISK